jgi:transposase
MARKKEPQDRQSLDLGLVEDLIAPDHYIRLLAAFVEKAVSENEEYYTTKGLGPIGQRPYGADTMLLLYVYGYLNRISSSRRLEVEAQRNIELIWLLGGLRPDFKTIADYRRDHGEQIRQLLRQFQQFLKDHAYVEGRQMTVDGMRTKANTARRTWSVKKIDNRLQYLDAKLNSYLKELQENDQVEDLRADLTELDKEKGAAIEQIARLQQEIADLLKKKGL